MNDEKQQKLSRFGQLDNSVKVLYVKNHEVNLAQGSKKAISCQEPDGSSHLAKCWYRHKTKSAISKYKSTDFFVLFQRSDLTKSLERFSLQLQRDFPFVKWKKWEQRKQKK